MTTDTRIALAGLALCDALDLAGCVPKRERDLIATARRHYHAVIRERHGIGSHPYCVCPDEAHDTCTCESDCICAAMAQGANQ